MARPSKLTPEREQRLLTAIRAGNTRRAAAAAAGIDQDTIANWCRRSSVFSDALTRAEGEAEVALVAIVRTAAKTDWRAGAWQLERRWPETWGRRERVDVTVRQQAEKVAQENGLDVDVLLAEAQRIVNVHGR